MVNFLIILTLIVAVLLILIILAQNPKGSGLSSQFTSSGATQIMGSHRTADILEKSSWMLASVIFVLCIVVNIVAKPSVNEQGGYVSPNVEAANEKTKVPINEGAQNTGAATTTPDSTQGK